MFHYNILCATASACTGAPSVFLPCWYQSEAATMTLSPMVPSHKLFFFFFFKAWRRMIWLWFDICEWMEISLKHWGHTDWLNSTAGQQQRWQHTWGVQIGVITFRDTSRAGLRLHLYKQTGGGHQTSPLANLTRRCNLHTQPAFH